MKTVSPYIMDQVNLNGIPPRIKYTCYPKRTGDEDPNNTYGVILIARVGHTLSHAIQKIHSLSLTGSHLSVLYFA